MSRARTRAAAERLGRRAEFLCRLSLGVQLYRVIARNWRSSFGELDLVAIRGRTIAFIEVKARPDLTAAAQAVSLTQRRRIERAASQFLASQPTLAPRTIRFDVMLVIPGRWPRHVRDAWRIGE